jgi:hypothetical protein
VLVAILLWLGIDGGLGFLRNRHDAAARYLAFYTAPLLFAVAVWLRERMTLVRGNWSMLMLADATVLTLAAVRFIAGAVVPFSGHMLFLSYSMLAVPVRRAYRLLALALLVETTIFKLLIWSDTRSWALGLALGVTAAGIAALSRRKVSVP